MRRACVEQHGGTQGSPVSPLLHTYRWSIACLGSRRAKPAFALLLPLEIVANGAAFRRSGTPELPAQRIGLHEVREGALSVDLDDREQLPVAGLELGVAADVDLGQLELELLPELPQRLAGALAEVAIRRVVENDRVSWQSQETLR